MTRSRKVVICGPLFGKAAERLPAECDIVYSRDAVMSQNAFRDAARDAWAILSMAGVSVDRAAIDSAPGLRIISHCGVGYDNVDAAYASTRDVCVTNTPDVLTESTAEMGFALLMAAARRVVEGDALMRAGRFDGWKMNLLLGAALHGKTLGILGCGRIGQSIARIAGGFRMRVVYHNRSRLSAEVEDTLNLTRVDFDELLAESDFIIIAAPLSAQTRHLFTFETFERMKRSAVVVNIGRGAIICENDLVRALKHRVIRAAALDVLESPPHLADELASLDNVVLTPHLGSATEEARAAMSDMAVDAIIDVHEGRKPRHIV